MSLQSHNNIVIEGSDVWRPTNPLMSRLPEPSHARRQNILGVSSTARNSVEGSRNAISTIRPANGKNWTVFWWWIRMCGIQQSEESGLRRIKGIQAEELYSVDQGNQICEVLRLRPVSGLWAQSTECMSRVICWEWFLKFWWIVLCSLLFCFICSVNKCCYLLNPGLSVKI